MFNSSFDIELSLNEMFLKFCLRAFKWEATQYGHLPNVVNKDGTKLSKRQGDISMKHYRDMLYYPRALSNFVTKSGGGFLDHNVDKIYSHEDLAISVLKTT